MHVESSGQLNRESRLNGGPLIWIKVSGGSRTSFSPGLSTRGPHQLTEVKEVKKVKSVVTLQHSLAWINSKMV
jgi:hypothetical protein